MAELAKTHITITDDSAYAAGIDTLIPLYVFATEQDKVIDETTGEIATGTTKALANQVSIVTSRKDVIDKFGAPKFYEDNGTVLQGDERNEYGLYGLFDAMGSTSLAYALRADIDLKGLTPAEEEPTSNVKNGTMWLDMYNTSLGLFKNNGETRPSRAWELIDGIELYSKNPEPTEGKQGDYAVYFDKGTNEHPTLTQVVKVKGESSWADLGTGFTVYHSKSTEYPEGTEQNPLVAGDIWVKTTSTNNGAHYALKRWVASSERWEDVELPLVASTEAATTLYGDSLKNGDYAFVYSATKAEGTIYVFKGDIKTGSWQEATDIVVSMTEPRAKATEGTIWFNDDLMVDIMINTGSSWKGYRNFYSEQQTPPNIYVTSEEPALTSPENSLWVNTLKFPEIRRFVGGVWELADSSDQTTPDGIVFADARYYADESCTLPTYSINDETGEVTSNLLTSDLVDPDAPQPQTYPKGILLFNTRFSTDNVKVFRESPFEGLYSTVDDPEDQEHFGKFKYTAGQTFYIDPAKADIFFKNRWVSASGNAADGSGLFGRDAQRKMVVNALAGAIKSNEDIRTYDYDFFFACCPGYPELDDELISLNVDKKEMFEIISDTPKTLKPDGKAIQEWGTNANNAVSHGAEGRVLKNEYVTRQYPPMGLASNVDGAEIAVPSSIAKMNNLLVLPRGQIAAGTQNGQVTNLASVGYITDEEEYASVVINDGLGEVCTAQSINPIMPRRNTGLLFWGEATENPITSSLSDEHAIITLLRLKRQLEAACLPFFFRINNPSLRNEFHKVLQDILNTFVGTGEIYDYALEVESENTNERINRKELWAAIAIEIAKGVEQIYIPIRVVATGALSD